jgi:DNA-binding NarL/FixJ family response regulator
VTPIRLVLADDHALVLEGLCSMIAGEPDLDVVQTAGDGEGFLTAVRLHRPDVAVMDLGMPGLGGLTCLDRLRADALPVRVLVLSGLPDAGTVRAAFERGAAGYALKTDPPRQILAAIRQIHGGQMVFPAAFRTLLLGEPSTDAGTVSLTERERAVLAALAEGRSNGRIADQLGVSVNTVKFHLQNLFIKLGVRNRTEAVAWYLRSGTPPLPDRVG